MESFQQDALRFGCLRGFKHMSLRPRGKEELLVTVQHRDDALGLSPGPSVTAPPPRPRDFSVDDDEPESPRAKSKREAKMADDEGEPESPRARPRRTELQAEELPTSPPRAKSAAADASTFLIGAYAKYDRPYVWLREGGRVRSDGAGADDLPLDLEALRVNDGATGFSARVWDVAEELVGMNVFPTPPNAFAVDHGAIRKMEPAEQFLAAGAMVGFLHDILEEGARRGGSGRGGKARGEVFVALMEEDIDKLVAAHLAEAPQALLDRNRA